MATLHENSPCCRGTVWRFGFRRRQCAGCRRTWRVWQRSRGRRRRRLSTDLIPRYLDRRSSTLCVRAAQLGLQPQAMSARIQRALGVFLERTPWPPLPDGTLIAIADAFMQRVGRSVCTCYLILLRRTTDITAVITPPTILPGRESWLGWQQAFASLPESVKLRIVAMVCDGHRGLTSLAQRHGWLLQRCHFHLLASVQGRRSRWVRSRHRAMGGRLYRLVRHVLATRDESTILPTLTALEVIAWDTHSPVLRKVLSGFITHFRDYRTYLEHPELHLPRTSNAVEAVVAMVRDLQHRARGFRGNAAFSRWLTALYKHHRTIICNGSENQPN